MKKLLIGMALLVSTTTFADVCDLNYYDANSDFKGLDARYKCTTEKSINHVEDLCFFSSADSVVHRFKTHVYGVDGTGVLRSSSLFDRSRFSPVVGKFEIIDNDDVYQIKKGGDSNSSTFSIDKSTLEGVEIKKRFSVSKSVTYYSCVEVN